MATAGALPGSFDRIGTTFVEHLHDQVAMETHGWMTKNQLSFCRLGCCNCHYSTSCSNLWVLSLRLRRCQFANYLLITACNSDEKGDLGRRSRGLSRSPWGIIG